MNDLLTAPQVAAILGVARSTVWRRWKLGELEAAGSFESKNGTVPLFKREYIEALAREATAKKAS
jgi:hypothetical protein